MALDEWVGGWQMEIFSLDHHRPWVDDSTKPGGCRRNVLCFLEFLIPKCLCFPVCCKEQ